MEQAAWIQLLSDLNRYIEAHYEGALPPPRSSAIAGSVSAIPMKSCAPCRALAIPEEDGFDGLLDVCDTLGQQELRSEAGIAEVLASFENIETFSEALVRIIKEKDLIEADVYHRVFMDRKLFNKIRNDRAYQPSKRTAILLAVALRLSIAETQEFLGKAGFSLTHTSKTDIIIEFFMMRGNYNVMEINAALYEHRLAPLNK